MTNSTKAKWFEWMFYAVILFFLFLFIQDSIHDANARESQRIQEETIQQQKREISKLKAEAKKKPPVKKVVQSSPKSSPQAPVVYAVALINCSKYKPLVEKYDWNVEVAMAVMAAESGCNPNAVSSTDDHGLFQLHGIRIYDPAKNVEYAYFNKYLKGGWSHWQVCVKLIVQCWA